MNRESGLAVLTDFAIGSAVILDALRNIDLIDSAPGTDSG